jgi:hypothetical protein
MFEGESMIKMVWARMYNYAEQANDGAGRQAITRQMTEQIIRQLTEQITRQMTEQITRQMTKQITRRMTSRSPGN